MLIALSISPFEGGEECTDPLNMREKAARDVCLDNSSYSFSAVKPLRIAVYLRFRKYMSQPVLNGVDQITYLHASTQRFAIALWPYHHRPSGFDRLHVASMQNIRGFQILA